MRQVIASFAGLGAVVAATTILVEPLDILAIPLGYAIGMAVKDVLLAVFLLGRVRGIGPGSEAAGEASAALAAPTA